MGKNESQYFAGSSSPDKNSRTREKAMKSAVLYTLVATLSLTTLNAFAQSCQTGGGQYPGVGPASPYAPNGTFPTAAEVQQFLSQSSAGVAAPVASPAAPQARITVVDPTEASATNSSAAGSTGSARITVVPDDSLSVPGGTSKSVTTGVDSSSIAEGLKGLVGNWTAVARVGDNELTTVELQLDDRGWATLTVPGTDGKKSTIKRRVEFKNDEIKLTGPDAETVLGKLVSFNSRQMVLEKAGGQVTFVRM
jgi:hypothetical protein